MKNLVIINDGPYGSERSYNALRLAGSLVARQGEEVRVFLIGDAAGCAKAGQKVPTGYYNIQLMLNKVLRAKGQVGVCGTCMDARALSDAELVDGVHRSTLAELTDWTQWADKVIVF